MPYVLVFGQPPRSIFIPDAFFKGQINEEAVETVLCHGACLKVAMKFRSLYFIMLNEGIRFARDLFMLGRGLINFLAASSTTMESLPLKVPDFGLQRPTGSGSGAVACLILVSLR